MAFSPLLAAAYWLLYSTYNLVLELPGSHVGDLFELLRELGSINSAKVPDKFSQKRLLRLKGPQRADRPASGA
jgi:hypothetical protein